MHGLIISNCWVDTGSCSLRVAGHRGGHALPSLLREGLVFTLGCTWHSVRYHFSTSTSVTPIRSDPHCLEFTQASHAEGSVPRDHPAFEMAAASPGPPASEQLAVIRTFSGRPPLAQ